MGGIESPKEFKERKVVWREHCSAGNDSKRHTKEMPFELDLGKLASVHQANAEARKADEERPFQSEQKEKNHQT